METMRGMGCAIGEYVGDGQGKSESATQELTSADLDPVVETVCIQLAREGLYGDNAWNGMCYWGVCWRWPGKVRKCNTGTYIC